MDTNCPHPPSRLYAWWAWNYLTGEDDILCIGCTCCGEILKGGEAP